METDDLGAPPINPIGHKVATTAIVGAWVLFALLEASVVFAAEPATKVDRLDTPACQNAQRELESNLASVDGKQPDEQFRLKLQIDKSRGVVASRCFDRAPESPTEAAEKAARRPAIQQPLAVEPVAAQPSLQAPSQGMAATTALAPTSAPPPVQIGRPTALTTCDGGGCWDSNGTRLNGLAGGASPVLIGPQGPCTAQGGVANCR